MARVSMADSVDGYIREELLKLQEFGYTDNPDIRKIAKLHPGIDRLHFTPNAYSLQALTRRAEEDKPGKYEIYIKRPLKLDDFSNFVFPQFNEIESSQNPIISSRRGSLEDKWKVSFLDRYLFGHELGHVVSFVNEFEGFHKLEAFLQVKENKYDFAEACCELFATYFVFPHEDDFPTAKKDILNLTKAPTTLEGMITLAKKRKMDMSTLIQRLARSQLYQEVCPDSFALGFSFENPRNPNFRREGACWRLLPGNHLLPKGVKFRDGFSFPLEFQPLTSYYLEDKKISEMTKLTSETRLWEIFSDVTSSTIYSPEIDNLEKAYKKGEFSNEIRLGGEYPCFESDNPHQRMKISEVNYCGLDAKDEKDRKFFLVGKVKRTIDSSP